MVLITNQRSVYILINISTELTETLVIHSHRIKTISIYDIKNE